LKLEDLFTCLHRFEKEEQVIEPLPDGNLDQKIELQVQTTVRFILEGLSNIIFQLNAIPAEEMT